MIGRTIGNHKIIERLGEGGMGIVYKAKQVSLFRMVAMKILPQHLTREPSFVARFFNEARAIASLNHPNIVQIYDVGKEGEYYYYTMELIDGVSLEEIVIRRRPISLDRAVRIISSVAKALDYTHKRGIIHRDIKPSNIMIDRSGRVKLTDFGLALQDRATRLTAEGGLIGTPEFMSPEQAYGQTATSLSDIYSLGVVFYELLTGSSPFEAETALAVIERIKTDIPELPRSLNPDIPPEIEEIIMKMMAKDPTDRYQNCREIRLDLKLHRTAETFATRESALSRGIGPSARNAIFTLLVALLIGLGFFLLKPRMGTTGPSEPKAVDEASIPEKTLAARKAMEQAMNGALTELVPMFFEAEEFHGVQAVEVRGHDVNISGEMGGMTRQEASRALSSLGSTLKEHCNEVKVTEGVYDRGVLAFRIKLKCTSSFGDMLASDTMMTANPMCGRVWQLAEEKRITAEGFNQKQKHVAAEKSYSGAAELYARTRQMALLTKELAALDDRIPTATEEAKAAGFPDIIVLDNSKEIECKIIDETADSVRIGTHLGTVQFQREKVRTIVRASPGDMAEMSATQSEVKEIQRQKVELRSKIDELHLLPSGIPSEILFRQEIRHALMPV